jgi:gas vesicle protein
MTKRDSLVPFLAGVGVGAAAAVLLAPDAGRKTRGRIAEYATRTVDAAKKGGQDIGDAAGEVLNKTNVILSDQRKKGNEIAANLGDKAKDTIDHTAGALKHAVNKVVAGSNDAAHTFGKTMEEGGKRLQNA